MVFYIIGLGLYDLEDVTMKGYKIIKNSKKVYLESYTSVLGQSKENLEKFYEREIITAYRETCESDIEPILKEAKDNKLDDYSFLVVGDPFCATTHSDLFLRAVNLGIEVRVIHNASIMNAIGATGLMLYLFGQTVSIPMFTEKWKPTSFMDKIKKNIDNNMHTLVLLDIKVREISEENIIKGINKYEPPYFMSINEAISQIEYSDNEKKLGIYTPERKVIGVSRMGSNDAVIKAGTFEELKAYDFGKPLHSLIICANELHDIEKEMFDYWRNK